MRLILVLISLVLVSHYQFLLFPVSSFRLRLAVWPPPRRLSWCVYSIDDCRRIASLIYRSVVRRDLQLGTVAMPWHVLALLIALVRRVFSY